MSKVREVLKYVPKKHFSKPEYVEHKKQLWWGTSERRHYRRAFTGYALEKAAFNFIYALATFTFVYNTQPRPAPVEIKLLSPGTSTQTVDTKPAASHSSEPIPAANTSTIFEKTITKPRILWTNRANNTTLHRPR